jgi:hypothetical protein
MATFASKYTQQKKSQTSKPNSRSVNQSNFNKVFSSLKEFDRSELLSIISESNRILSLECADIFFQSAR